MVWVIMPTQQQWCILLSCVSLHRYISSWDEFQGHGGLSSMCSLSILLETFFWGDTRFPFVHSIPFALFSLHFSRTHENFSLFCISWLIQCTSSICFRSGVPGQVFPHTYQLPFLFMVLAWFLLLLLFLGSICWDFLMGFGFCFLAFLCIQNIFWTSILQGG